MSLCPKRSKETLREIGKDVAENISDLFWVPVHFEEDNLCSSTIGFIIILY